MKDFKPILIFVGKFIGAWVILLIIYNSYLSKYHSQNLPDPYSQKVAAWTVSSLNALGFESTAVDDPNNPWTHILMDGVPTSYINEGCNAISIMIIFVAFIIAFSTTWKQTLIYILSGLLIIQVMNIARIVLLNYIFKFLPEYSEFAHDYLFPALLYGTIVVLWLVWVRFFALKHKRKNEQAA